MYRLRALALSIPILSLCASLFFPTTALAMCCKCQDTGTNKNICLVDTTITSCANILSANNKNTGLSKVVCEAAEAGDDNCKSTTGGAATCTATPQLAINYTPDTPEVQAAAAPTEKPPQLNIAIPGVSGQTVVSDGAYQVSPWFAGYVSSVYRYLVGASIIAAAIMVTYGGFLYITSSSIQGISDGKEYIKNALIGLFLVFSSVTILSTINPFLVTPTSLRVINISKVPLAAPLLKEVETSSKTAKGQTPSPPPATPGSAPPANPDGPSLPPPEDRGEPPKQTDTASTPPPGPTTLPPQAAAEAGGSGNIGTPPNDTGGCGPGRPSKPNDTTVFNFGWMPSGFEKWYGGAKYQRILVDGRIRNCPGNYPVIFFFHGNQGWHDLETPIGAITSYKYVMNKVIDKKLDYKPFIAVFLASEGKSETLWPGLKLSELRDAALAELQNHPETKGVGFESISIAGHSGSGCNKQFWGEQVPTIPVYAMMYGDMCMGYYDQKHAPEKSIAIISVMKNVDWANYLKQHGLEIKGVKCRKRIGAGYSLCAEHPTQDHYFFFENSNNHGWPITLSLQFALANFFPNK